MSNDTSPLKVTLQGHELRIIRLCINELANGLAMTDDEFLTRLGYSRQELLEVLGKLRPAKDYKGPVVIEVSPPTA
jgi:hypothetical protein